MISFSETADGIRVSVEVDETISTADLRGLFLNLSDDSLLAGLSISCPLVTDVDLSGDVINMDRSGPNVNGGGSPCPCDIGIEFGTPGAGSDDIQSTHFDLSHDSATLELALFAGQTLGVRLTSVEIEGNRDDSAKLTATVPEPAVPALLALTALAALRGPRRRSLGPKTA